jgi:hypothetical protein
MARAWRRFGGTDEKAARLPISARSAKKRLQALPQDGGGRYWLKSYRG